MCEKRSLLLDMSFLESRQDLGGREGSRLDLARPLWPIAEKPKHEAVLRGWHSHTHAQTVAPHVTCSETVCDALKLFVEFVDSSSPQ